MATTAKTLFRGAATTTVSTTLYTVPASTTAVVTEIVVHNASAVGYTFTLSLDGVELYTTTSIGSYATTVIPLKEVLTTGKQIKGGASNTAVKFHICGMEIA